MYADSVKCKKKNKRQKEKEAYILDYQIYFPHLHIYLQHVGKSISIGGFSIAYYGIVIACGMLAGIVLACYEAKKTGQNPDDYIDLAMVAIICSLIGARLYYVAFRWDLYKDDLISILKVREGGLAIYGGVIAAIITTLVFARVKKKSFGQLCDTAGLGLILGQIIGRWGNFFNREAFGDYTDSLFAMQLPLSAVRTSDLTEKLIQNEVVKDGITYIQVHPTFFYESALNLILLILLLVFRRKKKFQGEVFLWYLFGYGMIRFGVESLRTDQLLIPGIGYPVSKALAAVLIAVSAIWILAGRRRMAKETV